MPKTAQTVELPTGVTKEQVAKALKFYATRKSYQETHNKARRLALQRLAKKYPGEYKGFLGEELKKLGVEPKS